DRAAEQQAMRDYESTTGCRMEFLRRQLDDPEVLAAAAPCGRCDNCLATRLDVSVQQASLEAAQAALGRPGIDLEVRKLWPTGMAALDVRLSGKIGPDVQAEPGRALGRLSDIGWGTRLRAVLSAEDGAVPADVLEGVIAVLKGWSWENRPVGIVGVPSRSRPLLVGSLAGQLAEVGRLPLLGMLHRTRDDPPRERSNSAQRLRDVAGSLTVPTELAAQLGTGPVLLVDDVAVERWTLTEAARVLRLAGAPQVLPLVLALDA
ncbi:MAG: ATP-dependent helicase RecQ, partial [Frankiales bacterium]|nr:ATP-dependent helicase RecQ [Frankiales bacterium]